VVFLRPCYSLSRWPRRRRRARSLVDAADYYKAHPDIGAETLSHHIEIPPEVLKQIPIPPVTPTVDASQIRYWVDIMRQQKMLSKPMDPSAVLLP